MNFQIFRTNIAAVTLTFKISKKLKKPVWQMFPPTHPPNFIQISSAVSEKQGVTKLILDKEEKFLLASALSAIFKLNQNKRSLKSSLLPTYQVSFKYLQPFLRNRCVMHARPHGRTHARTYTSENNKLSLLRLTT
jgi:hypothetical protein